MKKESRMSRYQNLRDEMIENKNDELIDEHIWEEQTSIQEKASYQPAREKEVTPTPEFKTDQFHNEYLDEFIKEVKEYNIKKGNAFSEDTQLNVLKELIESQTKRDEYIEEVEDVSFFDDISRQVEDLANHKTIAPEEIIREINQNVVEEKEQVEEQVDETTVIIPEYHFDSEQLLEQTRKIEVRMEEYKDDVEKISSAVNRTGIILNVIVGILIVLIIGVIVFALYFIMTRG